MVGQGRHNINYGRNRGGVGRGHPLGRGRAFGRGGNAALLTTNLDLNAGPTEVHPTWRRSTRYEHFMRLKESFPEPGEGDPQSRPFDPLMHYHFHAFCPTYSEALWRIKATQTGQVLEALMEQNRFHDAGEGGVEDGEQSAQNEQDDQNSEDDQQGIEGSIGGRMDQNIKTLQNENTGFSGPSTQQANPLEKGPSSASPKTMNRQQASGTSWESDNRFISNAEALKTVKRLPDESDAVYAVRVAHHISSMGEKQGASCDNPSKGPSEPDTERKVEGVKTKTQFLCNKAPPTNTEMIEDLFSPSGPRADNPFAQGQFGGQFGKFSLQPPPGLGIGDITNNSKVEKPKPSEKAMGKQPVRPYDAQSIDHSQGGTSGTAVPPSASFGASNGQYHASRDPTLSGAWTDTIGNQKTYGGEEEPSVPVNPLEGIWGQGYQGSGSKYKAQANMVQKGNGFFKYPPGMESNDGVGNPWNDTAFRQAPKIGFTADGHPFGDKIDGSFQEQTFKYPGPFNLAGRRYHVGSGDGGVSGQFGAFNMQGRAEVIPRVIDRNPFFPSGTSKAPGGPVVGRDVFGFPVTSNTKGHAPIFDPLRGKAILQNPSPTSSAADVVVGKPSASPVTHNRMPADDGTFSASRFTEDWEELAAQSTEFLKHTRTAEKSDPIKRQLSKRKKDNFAALGAPLGDYVPPWMRDYKPIVIPCGPDGGAPWPNLPKPPPREKKGPECGDPDYEYQLGICYDPEIGMTRFETPRETKIKKAKREAAAKGLPEPAIPEPKKWYETDFYLMEQANRQKEADEAGVDKALEEFESMELADTFDDIQDCATVPKDEAAPKDAVHESEGKMDYAAALTTEWSSNVRGKPDDLSFSPSTVGSADTDESGLSGWDPAVTIRFKKPGKA